MSGNSKIHMEEVRWLIRLFESVVTGLCGFACELNEPGHLNGPGHGIARFCTLTRRATRRRLEYASFVFRVPVNQVE